MIDKQLFGEAKQYKGRFFLLVVLGVGAGGLAVLQAYYMANLIDGAFIKKLDIGEMKVWLLLLAVVMGGRSIVAWLTEWAAHTFAGLIKRDIRQRLVRHMTALGPAYLAEEQSGELVTLLTEGVENLEPYFAKYLPQVFAAAAIPVLVLGTVLPVDWGTGLLLLVTAPLIPVFMMLIGRMAQSRNEQQWETLSRLSAHFLDVLQGLATLKIFGRSREQAQVVERMSRQFRHTTLGVLRIAFLSALVLELAATISTAIVAVTVGIRLLYFHIEFHEAFFVLLLAPEFYLPLRQLGLQYHAGLSGVASARRIFELLSLVPGANQGGSRRLAVGEPVEVAFDKVAFSYQGGSREALAGVSFSLKPGERVALVGASGSGKSTVASLLIGFIRPDQGNIYVNGLSLEEISRKDWLANLAVVPQAPHLFYRSVEENIRLGREWAGREEVEAAAKAAGAHGFISQLPQGYDTLIGQGGHELSGGEAKRIALARAFIQQAPLLLLDEATAGLDVYRESEVEEAVERLMEGRTVLMIAHRLSTVRKAHRVLVMDGGQIVEEGTHEELISRQGAYFELLTAYRGEE